MAEPNASTDTIPYVITLKSRNHMAINAVSQLLLVIFLLAFGFYFVQARPRNYWQLVVPALMVVLWIYGYLRNREPGWQMHFRTELMMAAMACLVLPLFPYARWFGVGLALMSVLERWVKRPDELSFTEEGVVRNSFPPKRYQWFEIDNAVIRDNIFTLDLRNNHIIQQPLDEPVPAELQEEFNQWCQQQLHFTQQA